MLVFPPFLADQHASKKVETSEDKAFCVLRFAKTESAITMQRALRIKIDCHLRNDNNILSESEEAGSTNASGKPVCLQNETVEEDDVELTGGVANSGKITDGSNLFLLKVSETFDECLYDVSHISNSGIRDKVQTLIENYSPNKTETTALKMKIILSEEKPIAQRSRRLSLPEKREVEKQIDEWLEQGIIRESCSDFSSPVVVCKKKDGTMCDCV
ncbi:retrovirus-related Pol polyprotein from transposon 17.6 [Trichonephila clavipes]|nr:retrovirus-related Pol polyprotein from transposon 17.6 [Trichonephila clavipes]